jgi:hypothetical protein
MMLPVCCLVVLVSIVLHGFSPMVLLRQPHKPEAPPALSAAPPAPAPAQIPAELPQTEDAGPTCPLPERPPAGTPVSEPSHNEYVSIEELQQWWRSGVPVVVLDARTDRTYNDSDQTAQNSLRLHPDWTTSEASKLKIPKEALIAVFCA